VHGTLEASVEVRLCMAMLHIILPRLSRPHPNDVVTPRRSFFTRIAASAMAIGFAGLGSAPARAAAGADDGPDWPGELKGRHRRVVDAYAPNDGFPLAFAFPFVVTNGKNIAFQEVPVLVPKRGSLNQGARRTSRASLPAPSGR
jgi:hypothetical protein